MSFRPIYFILIAAVIIKVSSSMPTSVQRFLQGSTEGCAGKTSVIRNGKEYKLFNTKMTYSDAESSCLRWGRRWGSSSSRLAIIRDGETQTCLTQMIQTPSNYNPEDWAMVTYFSRGYYVGASDRNSEGVWTWRNGDIVPKRLEDGFQNWGIYEPNNYENEDCMTLLMRQIPSFPQYVPGKWIDLDCNSEQFYICERDISEDLIWGYSNNIRLLTPEKWHETYPKCSGDHQSPVDIDITTNQDCNDGPSVVANWNSDVKNAQWVIRNTGRTIEIEPNPANSIYTIFQGSDERHYVDKVHLKWGPGSHSGSEHTISGIRHAGEMQIFHHAAEGSQERHAIAFMIQQRTFQSNEKWSQLFHHITMVQEIGLESVMQSPDGHFKHLLGDSASRIGRMHVGYIGEVGVRYRGSLTAPPCNDNIIWTVYPRPIALSYHQFSILRRMHMEGGRSMNTNRRPLQPRSGGHCLVR